MELLTVDDLANKICDWVGCYGGCTESTDGDGCEKKEIFCCRIGAMLVLPDMIIKAVRNDDFLDRLDKEQSDMDKMKAHYDRLESMALLNKQKQIDIIIEKVDYDEDNPEMADNDHYMAKCLCKNVGEPGFVVYRETESMCIMAMARKLYDKGFEIGNIQRR